MLHITDHGDHRFNNEPVLVGAGHYLNALESLHGVIDDVIVFRGALSQAEVADLCHQPFHELYPLWVRSEDDVDEYAKPGDIVEYSVVWKNAGEELLLLQVAYYVFLFSLHPLRLALR